MDGESIYTGIQAAYVQTGHGQERLVYGHVIPADIDDADLRNLQQRGLVGRRPGRIERREVDPNEGNTVQLHRLGLVE